MKIRSYGRERIFDNFLNSQLSAAFDAAALNHSAASFGSNTCTKAVSTGAVTRVWLVSSFWHICNIVPNSPTFDKITLEFYSLYDVDI